MTINTFATCFNWIQSKDIIVWNFIILDLLDEKPDVTHTRVTMAFASINETASERVKVLIIPQKNKQHSVYLPQSHSCSIWPITQVSFPTQIRRKDAANTTCTSSSSKTHLENVQKLNKYNLLITGYTKIACLTFFGGKNSNHGVDFPDSTMEKYKAWIYKNEQSDWFSLHDMFAVQRKG